MKTLSGQNTSHRAPVNAVTAQDERWVIIFLIYADFVNDNYNKSISVINEHLLETLDSLCEDIIRCKMDENKFSVYAVFSTLNYENPVNGRFPSSSQTILFSIVPSDSSTKNSITAIPIESQKGQVIQPISVHKIADLSAAFRKIDEIEKNKYPEKEYRILLNTWDHGAAFGIFKRNHRQIDRMFKWTDVAKLAYCFYIGEFINATLSVKKHQNESALVSDAEPKAYYLINNTVKSIPIDQDPISFRTNQTLRTATLKLSSEAQLPDPDEYKIELLSNRELADSLELGFRKKRVDVLIMMNCWMMNLDTAYWLKDNVRFLIAPQTGIEFPAYNYQSILNYIYTSLTISNKLDPDDLAKHCITSLSDSSGKRASGKEYISKWAIFAMKLTARKDRKSALPGLIEAIAAFSCHMEQHIQKAGRNNPNAILELKNLIKFCTQLSYNFDEENGCYQYDLLHMIFNITRFHNGKFDRIKLANFKKAISQYQLELISYKHIGNEWENQNCYSVRNNIYPTALSIYMPFIPYQNNEIFLSFIKPDMHDFPSRGFFNNCKAWLEFIDTILK